MRAVFYGGPLHGCLHHAVADDARVLTRQRETYRRRGPLNDHLTVFSPAAHQEDQSFADTMEAWRRLFGDPTLFTGKRAFHPRPKKKKHFC